MSLSRAEEELMRYIWDLKSAQMKDLLACYPPPKPAATTIATLLKRIYDKGYINYQQEGKSRRYFPIVPRKRYFSGRLKSIISDFFDGSNSQFASFFTQEGHLTEEELRNLKKIIDQKLKSKK